MHGRLLGRSVGYSPSDILAVDLSESNDYTAQQDSPYHSDYPTASRLWLFPDESRVLDDAGMIYAVPDLTWTGSVAGRIEGAVFTADSPERHARVGPCARTSPPRSGSARSRCSSPSPSGAGSGASPAR